MQSVEVEGVKRGQRGGKEGSRRADVIALFSGCATALESRESVSVSAYVFYTPILCVLYVNMYMYIYIFTCINTYTLLHIAAGTYRFLFLKEQIKDISITYIFFTLAWSAGSGPP